MFSKDLSYIEVLVVSCGRSVGGVSNTQNLEAKRGAGEIEYLLCNGLAFQSIYLYNWNSWKL